MVHCVCVCVCLHAVSFKPDKLQQETESFLNRKEEWKKEIEVKLEKLKTVERELTNKEQELQEVC